MESRVLYEASFTFQPVWLLILAFLVIMPYAIVKNMKAFQQKKSFDSITGLVFSIIGTLVILIVVALVLPDQIKMYENTVGAFKRGDYDVVEGYVENFHPMPKEGHDTESFYIDGVQFKYGYTVSFGYHKAKVDGGVITENGQHLRIGYTWHDWLGNVIVYIEELP